jgi:hypothetical protein
MICETLLAGLFANINATFIAKEREYKNWYFDPTYLELTIERAGCLRDKCQKWDASRQDCGLKHPITWPFYQWPMGLDSIGTEIKS